MPFVRIGGIKQSSGRRVSKDIASGWTIRDLVDVQGSTQRSGNGPYDRFCIPHLYVSLAEGVTDRSPFQLLEMLESVGLWLGSELEASPWSIRHRPFRKC